MRRGSLLRVIHSNPTRVLDEGEAELTQGLLKLVPATRLSARAAALHRGLTVARAAGGSIGCNVVPGSSVETSAASPPVVVSDSSGSAPQPVVVSDSSGRASPPVVVDGSRVLASGGASEPVALPDAVRDIGKGESSRQALCQRQH